MAFGLSDASRGTLRDMVKIQDGSECAPQVSVPHAFQMVPEEVPVVGTRVRYGRAKLDAGPMKEAKVLRSLRPRFVDL